MKTKYIIFDFDGTIGDSKGLIVKTFQDTMRKLGREVKSEQECAGTIGMRLSEAFSLLYHSSKEDGETCAEVYRSIFEQNKSKMGMKMFPHVEETIRELYSRGFLMAVASSRGRESLCELLAQMRLSEYMSSIVAQEDVKHVKPAPDMVYRALGEMAGKSMGESEIHTLNDDLRDMAADTLVIGDMAFDVEMAHNAGAKACAVTYGNGTRAQLSHAEWLIDDLGEILGKLK